jgi:hypothetical protein
MNNQHTIYNSDTNYKNQPRERRKRKVTLTSGKKKQSRATTWTRERTIKEKISPGKEENEEKGKARLHSFLSEIEQRGTKRKLDKLIEEGKTH